MTYSCWNSGNDVAIFRVGDVPEHGISLQDFKHPMIFWMTVEETCTFQNKYGVRKDKLQNNGQVDSKKHKLNRDRRYK
jgi:hypothetical protein